MVEAGDVGTLKVAELKTELSARGLDTKGKKVPQPLPHAPFCLPHYPSLASWVSTIPLLWFRADMLAVLCLASRVRDSVAVDPPANECVGQWLCRLRKPLPPVHTAVWPKTT